MWFFLLRWLLFSKLVGRFSRPGVVVQANYCQCRVATCRSVRTAAPGGRQEQLPRHLPALLAAASQPAALLSPALSHPVSCL